MKKDQALQIIKSALDMAIKNGTFANLEAASAIATAYQTIIELIKNEGNV